MSATQPLDFRTARLRLVERINHLVHSGQLTERRLARLTGVSQPHIHNILKGIRTLTPDVADLVLEHLDLDLLDLFERERIDSHP
ncbi:MAG TPA: helix-turn-helix domain-containing protein [Bryobacteraceae bacterium]|nr:helix-turn-helix domain-containing protein [Bryobacteraceae bacterium]